MLRELRRQESGTFSWALTILKAGGRVARTGWNGKRLHVYLAKFSRRYEPAICIRTQDGKHQPGWVPSQADMLADDWVRVS